MRTQAHLATYYAVEALSSLGSTMFMCCLYFWTRNRLGFTDTANLWLSAVYGMVYVPAALWGGRWGDRRGYDRVLRANFAVMGLLLLAAPHFPSSAMPYLLLAAYTACIAPTWPSIEAAQLHSPGAMTLARRVGWYNITWAFANATGFLLGGLAFNWRPDAIFRIPGLIHLAQSGWLLLSRSSPRTGGSPAMEIPHPSQAVPQERKRRFMHLGWLANSLSYLMMGVFTALLPHQGERLHLAPVYIIGFTSVFFLSRAAAFVLFARWEGWQYRMGWMLGTLWLAPACFAPIFFSSQLPWIWLALVGWGLAAGLAYDSSIYYSMEYGEQKGKHGGLHEAVLGSGALLGPLAGVLGVRLTGSTGGAIALLLIVVTAANLAGLAAAAGWKRTGAHPLASP